jgi:hypothetical protein
VAVTSQGQELGAAIKGDGRSQGFLLPRVNTARGGGVHATTDDFGAISFGERVLIFLVFAYILFLAALAGNVL